MAEGGDNMLYSNVQKTIVSKKFKFGSLLGIVLGGSVLETFIAVYKAGIKEGDLLFDKKDGNLYVNEKLGISFSKYGPVVVDSEAQRANGVILHSGSESGSDNGEVNDVENGKIIAIGMGGNDGNTWDEALIEPLGVLTAHVHTVDGKDYYLKYRDRVNANAGYSYEISRPE